MAVVLCDPLSARASGRHDDFRVRVDLHKKWIKSALKERIRLIKTEGKKLCNDDVNRVSVL